jgi:hypothetical protein
MTGTRILQTGDPGVLEASDGRLALTVPIEIKRRSSRMQMTLPGGEPTRARPWDPGPNALQQALARAHRWQGMLDTGQAGSVKAIATREGLDARYVGRTLNLTTLAPDIVAAILDDTLPSEVTLLDLTINPPVLWEEQRGRIAAT